MAYYVEHFRELRDGLIVRPAYTLRHCMRFGSLSASFELIHIGFGWKLITIFHEYKGFSYFSIYSRMRWRSILFLGVSYITRSEVGIIAFFSRSP